MAGSDLLPSEADLLAAIATFGAGANHGDMLGDSTLPETKYFGRIKSAIADIDHLTWNTYTPVLTGSTTNPTLGTAGINYGKYTQIGNLVLAYFNVAFDATGTGVNGGSGLYSVSLPVNCNTDGTAAGISSEQLGHGLLLRGASGDSLGPSGAHMHVAWHAQDGVNNAVLGVIPQQTPYDYVYAEGTNADSLTAGTPADITGASASITVRQTNARYRIVGTTPWYTAADDNSLYLMIKEGSTILRQAPSYIYKANSLKQATARVEYVLSSPTLGSHTYKLTANAALQNATIAYDNTNKQYPRIEIQQIAYATGGEYVSDVTPWAWGDSVTGAQMWGRLIYEAA